jgi:CSLREA domain-containing protein
MSIRSLSLVGEMRSRRVTLFALAGVVAMVATFFLVLAAKPAHASTTFTVNSPEDFSDVNPGDGICDASDTFLNPCTLRAAIQEANATAAADTIDFNIPANATKTISPSFGFDAIIHPVIIDGYSQGKATADPADDATPNTSADGNNAALKIELSGAQAEPGNVGLAISAANSTVKGLIINRWTDQGVVIKGSGNKVEGNFIGTDAPGTSDLGNSLSGVFIFDAPNNTIGGTTAAARNLISGNGQQGVNIGGAGATGNKVQGNFIGTNAAGTAALANSLNGVFISDVTNNTIGGTVAGARNLISGNTQAGVVVGSPVAKGNRILRNSIFSNGGLGIDLGGDGVTPNDPKDPDTGPNRLQNFPNLSSANVSGGQVTIAGSLNSNPRKTFTIQFFSNPITDPNEGRSFIGQTTVKTNRQGNRSFNVTFTPLQSVSAGQRITATATKKKTSDTSEFSAPVTVS